MGTLCLVAFLYYFIYLKLKEYISKGHPAPPQTKHFSQFIIQLMEATSTFARVRTRASPGIRAACRAPIKGRGISFIAYVFLIAA